MTTKATTFTKTDRYINTAFSIGAQLAREAVWHNNACNWVGPSLEFIDNRFQVVEKALAADRYSGIAGVALFLAELYGYTNDQVILNTLTGSLKTLSQQLDNGKLSNKFGVFAGQLGGGYTCFEIGSKLSNPLWQELGLMYIDKVMAKPVPETEIDVISGAAGAIPVFIKLFNTTREKKYLDAANRLGIFLIDKATDQNNALCWKTVDAQHALTGYSHGNAGMAVALLDLYVHTNDDQFLQAAEKAFNYERQWFNPQENNWPDLREHTSGQPLKYGDMWCHGAPGIALSRLKAHWLTQKP